MPFVPLFLTLASALTLPGSPPATQLDHAVMLPSTGGAHAVAAHAPAIRAIAPARQCPPAERRYCDELAGLARDPAIRKALAYIEATDSAALRDLVMLTQIPAPPF
jgi:hypothetical protein